MTDPSQAPPPSVSGPPGHAPRAAFPMSEEALSLARSLATQLAEAVTAEDDRAEKSMLLHETAEIEERVRNDELTAAKNYLAAFNARPQFRPPLFALIRLYTRRKSVTNLAKLLEALIKAAPSESEKADAIVERGSLMEDRLEDAIGARGAYEEAVIVDGVNRNAWIALERIALKEKDHDLLHRALLKLAELTNDPNRKARLLTEVAGDLARVGTPEALDQASHLLQEAAGQPLGRWRALVEIERFAERTNRPQDLVFALEGRASLAASVAGGESFQGGSGSFAISRLQDTEEARQTAADLWSRASRVRLGSLNDAEGAGSAMEQALALKPDDTRFRVYAMQVADLAGDTGAAAVHAAWLLEREYGDPSTVASLHFRIAEACAAQGDMTGAGHALRKSIEAHPNSPAALGALVDQMMAAGDGVAAADEFERLATLEEHKVRKAALFRTAAMLSLALAADPEAATRRFREASVQDPTDVVSRRALLVLLAPKAHGDDARPLLVIIDELLKLAPDEDDRVVLLLDKLRIERFELKTLDAAAETAQALAEATPGDRFALETALALRSAEKAYGPAAKLAEQLAAASSGDDRVAYTATAARLHQAAGDEARARTLALGLHKEAPGDPYLATMSFRFALAAADHAGALDVLLRKTDASQDESATRWLLMGAVLLANAGAKDASRRALERAAERSPASPAVRAALLATTRWRGDGALRTKLAEAAIASPEAGDEEVALGVELVLAKVFLEHDLPAAMEALDPVVAKAGSESLSVSLLNAIALGSQRGPDAEETVNALQGLLNVLPVNDTVRVAIELEVARALSSSSATSDQAREVRQLLDEEQPHSVAPRLLALLDAIQREDRVEVPTALVKVAESADANTAAVMRSLAMAAMRAQGRETEALALATKFPDLRASAVALSELSVNVEQASIRSNGLFARIAIADESQRPGLARRAAAWSSLAGRDDEAVASVEALLGDDPDDLIAWDLLRVAGRRRALWPRVVEACVSLAERVKDASRASALWEEAGVVYLDQIGETQKAEVALRNALESDPRRVLAYRRLREILEKRKDHVALEALVTTRIAATQEPEELAELLWEQARFRRAQGRREEALESAKNVVLLEPEHVAAWAMVAEVHASSGRLEEAADALTHLARAKECPPGNRKVARMGALDIYDVRLKQPDKAIEQLDALVAEGDADDKLVERGVSIASKVEMWDAALRFARIAADRARSPLTKSTTLLRVAEILRDRLADSDAALKAAQSAHDAMPSRLEALRAVHALADDDERARRSKRTIEALREAMRAEGPSAEHALAIDQAAELGGDRVLARSAQRLASALGAPDVTVTRVGVPAGKPSLRDAGLALRFRDVDDVGAGVLLLESVLPDMVEMVGLATDDFGVGRGDRVRGSGQPVRDAVAPYAAVAGFSEFELYVGGNDDKRIAVIPGDPVNIVLGRKVTPPFDELTRYRLLRALLLSARGLAALQVVSVNDAADIVLAALAAAELSVSGGTQRFEGRLRPVAKALTRKVRKAIAESGRALAGAPDPMGELVRGGRAALSTVRRGVLAGTGAVNVALEDLRSADPSPPARRDLCLFLVSDALVTLERELGVDRA